jgi:hypothetical protein
MVGDVCHARFGIYYELPTVIEGARGYQTFAGSMRGKKWIIGIGLDDSVYEGDVKDVQRELVDMVKRRVHGGGVELYSGLYKYAGDDAQPDGRPRIEESGIGGGEWVMLVIVVDGHDGGKGDLGMGELERMVGQWAGDIEMTGGKGLKVGVWEGEVDLS